MPEPSVKRLIELLKEQAKAEVEYLEDRLQRIVEEYQEVRNACGPKLISSPPLDAAVDACDRRERSYQRLSS